MNWQNVSHENSVSRHKHRESTMSENSIKTAVKKRKAMPRGKPIKKGEIRNPHGRPRKEDTMSDCIREYLAGEITTENGEKLTRMQIAARAMYKKAINGDPSMMREMLDRGFGKVTQMVDSTIRQENPIIAMLKKMQDEDDETKAPVENNTGKPA